MTATGLGLVCRSAPGRLAALVAGPAGRAQKEIAALPRGECEKCGQIIKATGSRNR